MGKPLTIVSHPKPLFQMIQFDLRIFWFQISGEKNQQPDNQSAGEICNSRGART